MSVVGNFLFVMLKTTLRDRVLHALFVCALLLLFLIPLFSLFSMRQVQELSITLSLSAISFILLVFTLLLGSSSIWRDVEKRYTTSVLGLPISRTYYVLGKFAGLSIFIAAAALVLGGISLTVIAISSSQYQSELQIVWGNIIAAIAADTLKYILLGACALFFSSVSTSIYFPFFSTLSVFLAGSASQEVFEYLAGDYGKSIHPFIKMAVNGLYYLLPNFSAFNLKVQAIYSLSLDYSGLAYTFVYFLVYTSLLLGISIRAFARRELP